MVKVILVALSNSVSKEREVEFNHNEINSKEVTGLKGFVSAAQR